MDDLGRDGGWEDVGYVRRVTLTEGAVGHSGHLPVSLSATGWVTGGKDVDVRLAADRGRRGRAAMSQAGDARCGCCTGVDAAIVLNGGRLGHCAGRPHAGDRGGVGPCPFVLFFEFVRLSPRLLVRGGGGGGRPWWDKEGKSNDMGAERAQHRPPPRPLMRVRGEPRGLEDTRGSEGRATNG